MLNQPWYYFAESFGIVLFVNLVAGLVYRQYYKTPRIRWAIKTQIVHPSHAVQPVGTGASGDVVSEKLLTVSRVVFWNAGLNAITRSGALSNKPLKLKTGEKGNILSTRLLKQNNPSDPIRIELTGDTGVAIKFVSLSHHAGGIVEVVHRGSPVVLTGEISEAVVERVSVDSINLDEIPFVVFWFWAKQPLRLILKTIFYGLGMAILGLALPEVLLDLNPNAGLGLIVWPWARALFVVLMVLWCAWQLWKPPGVPEGLSEFYRKMK